MSYGRMTANLLARFVGTAGAGTTTAQLTDIPMWWALFSDDALLAPDPLTVEIGSGAYVRPPTTWIQFSTTGLVNSPEVAFHAIPPGSHIACVGLFDAAINGNLLAADTIDTPVDMPLGGTWVLPEGEYFLGFDLTGL